MMNRRILLKSGLVGQVATDEPHHVYTKARFEYMMRGGLGFSKQLLYCVHPAVGDYLRMLASEDYGPIFPIPEGDDLWDI